MSDADRDAQVWDAVGGDPEELAVDGDDAEPETEYVTFQTFLTFQQEVLRRLSTLERQLDGDGDVEPEGPPIVKYAQMSEADRQDHLGTSDHIAVVLHENWQDVAWQLGGARDQISGEITERRFGVDTKTKANAKYNPSRLRHRLKQLLDRDFQATEIYRGLKALAKLSGGEERVEGAASRVHIVGGWYEYRERSTADGQDVRRVLWRDGG